MKKTTIICEKRTFQEQSDRIRKAMDETEDFHVRKIGRETGQKIITARMAKNWKRKDLARAINEKENIVASFEDGSAVYNPQLLQKFFRILGIKN